MMRGCSFWNFQSSALLPSRDPAEQVFSRAAGAPLVRENGMLVPGLTDIPVLRAISRSGYRAFA